MFPSYSCLNYVSLAVFQIRIINYSSFSLVLNDPLNVSFTFAPQYKSSSYISYPISKISLCADTGAPPKFQLNNHDSGPKTRKISLSKSVYYKISFSLKSQLNFALIKQNVSKHLLLDINKYNKIHSQIHTKFISEISLIHKEKLSTYERSHPTYYRKYGF